MPSSPIAFITGASRGIGKAGALALAEAGNAEELMQWLIAPVPLDAFMRDMWERRPVYVSRNAHKGYFDGLLSKDDIDAWLRAGKMVSFLLYLPMIFQKNFQILLVILTL